MLLSLLQETLLIAWFVSHSGGGPDKINVLSAMVCVALQFMATHPVRQHIVAWMWDGLAEVGGESFLAKTHLGEIVGSEA